MSSRFSQEACEELEKVAERINQSVELNLGSETLDQEEDESPLREPMLGKEEKNRQSQQSQQSL